MKSTRSALLAVGTPAIASSFAIMAFASVGKELLLIQLLAVCFALGLAWLRLPSSSSGIILLSLAGAALPLFAASFTPHRWLALGPLNLYLAPVLIPAFLIASSTLSAGQARNHTISCVATLLMSVLLALQPDASQVLALLVASAFTLIGPRSRLMMSLTTLGLVSSVAVWTFLRPDSLSPIPYVEGVFALAFSHSLLAGSAVIVGALVLVGGLYWRGSVGPSWLYSIGTYYAVLFACSALGLTPAPLMGYGAGPLLGFGIMVALSQSVKIGTDSRLALRIDWN